MNKDLTHVGYAADGFPIFVSQKGKYKSSYVLKAGKRPSGKKGPGGKYDGTYTADYQYKSGSGSLDQCNGVTVSGKYYIYILTEEFPHIPRCWSGEPHLSFAKSKIETTKKSPPPRKMPNVNSGGGLSGLCSPVWSLAGISPQV